MHLALRADARRRARRLTAGTISMARQRTLTLITLALVACDLPRDSDGTLDRIRGGALRVGVLANPPWVIIDSESVTGVEAQLVTEVAHTLGARPVWVRGTEANLFESLKQRELDLVIGGITDDEPWRTEVAFTKPYYADTVVVAMPPGRALIRGLKGKTVYVEPDDPLSKELKKRGATVDTVSDLARANGAIAAPSWHLTRLGFTSTGITLGESRHVMATSPGENGWLVHLERFLNAHESDVPMRLRQARP
jgi:polar amino acid transport system substrate-binding protein